MSRKKHRGGRGKSLPSSIDPAFADALADDENRSSSDFSPKRDYKALQLCRQAQRALSLALPVMADEILADLIVADVTPAPNASHLLVHIIVPTGRSAVDVIQHLDAAAGRLRAAVAHAITRKRAP